jgi:diadenosine tetraphosphate (Ap4A) HIT family hydrolase
MLIPERIALAREAKLPTVVRRVPSGWAVLGDQQFLEGYSVLLADPMVSDLTDLAPSPRARFLLDMSLIGQALMAVTPAYRINYKILGNTDPWLHAHVMPRFAAEPDEYRALPAWVYPKEQRDAAPFSPDRHANLMAALGDQLDRLLSLRD